MVCQYETSEEVGNVELPHLAHSRLPRLPCLPAGRRQAGAPHIFLELYQSEEVLDCFFLVLIEI